MSKSKLTPTPTSNNHSHTSITPHPNPSFSNLSQASAPYTVAHTNPLHQTTTEVSDPLFITRTLTEKTDEILLNRNFRGRSSEKDAKKHKNVIQGIKN
jgi:hypothetical protein